MSTELFLTVVALSIVTTAVFCLGLWFVLHLIIKEAAAKNLGLAAFFGEDEEELTPADHFSTTPVGFPPSLGRE